MKEAIVRNAAILVGLLLSGTACVLAAPYMISPRGGVGPSVLLAESPFVAMAAVIVCLAVATVVSGVVGRIINAAVGLFVLGAGLFVLSSRLETVKEVALLPNLGAGGFQVSMLALECLLFTMLCFLSVFAVFRIAGPLPDVQAEEKDGSRSNLLSHVGPRVSARDRAIVRLTASIFSALPVGGPALKSLLCGLLMLPLIWLFAQSPMKGQMLGATFCGSLAVGLVGRLVAPKVQPLALFVVPIIGGALGYLIGLFSLTGSLDQLWVAGNLPKLILPMPVDYAAGSLMGVAVGVGWASSFVRHEQEHDESADKPVPA